MDKEQNTDQKALLNGAQRRSLSVSLSLLEEKLLLLRLLSEREDYDGILYRLHVDFNPTQKKELDTLIADILSKISFLKKTFGLLIKTERFSKLMYAAESYFWTVLMDEKSAKLKRYGPVSNKLSAALDPTLEKIVRSLNQINQLSINNPQGKK